jgi:hypothetical protein
VFYLPRHAGDGREPVAIVVDGSDCDIWSLPPSPKVAPAGGLFGTKPSAINEAGEFADPGTGEYVDLRRWAGENGRRFEIVTALKARAPGIFVGRVTAGGHHHIRCANEDAHTDAGTDNATFVVNASETKTGGFVIHCRHAHCTDKDRLFFIARMLEQGWLTIADLTD